MAKNACVMELYGVKAERAGEKGESIFETIFHITIYPVQFFFFAHPTQTVGREGTRVNCDRRCNVFLFSLLSIFVLFFIFYVKICFL